jgi:hypothetical protein
MQELYFLLDFWSHIFPDDDNGLPRDLLAFHRYLQTLNPVLHLQKMLLHNKSKKLKKAQRLLEEFGGKKTLIPCERICARFLFYFWNFQFKMCFPAKIIFQRKGRMKEERWGRSCKS